MKKILEVKVRLPKWEFSILLVLIALDPTDTLMDLRECMRFPLFKLFMYGYFDHI